MTTLKKIEKEIHDMRALARELESRAKALEVRLARGTEDVTDAARGPSDAERAARARARASATEYRVGDEGPTPELIEAVERLISDRPRTFRELLDLTGARRGRVSGAIVALQTRHGREVRNLGTPQKAVWYLRRK